MPYISIFLSGFVGRSCFREGERVLGHARDSSHLVIVVNHSLQGTCFPPGMFSPCVAAVIVVFERAQVVPNLKKAWRVGSGT
eukprot:1550554-Pyramimonas_sp.AAC.1